MSWNPTPILPPIGQLGWRAPVRKQIQSPAINATAHVLSPTVGTFINLAVPQVNAVAAVRPVSVGVSLSRAVPRVDAVAQARVPVVASSYNEVVPQVNAVAAAPAPVVSAGVNLTVPQVNALAAITPPQVGMAINTPIVVPPINVTAAIAAPNVGAGRTITVGQIPAVAAAPAPGVRVDQARVVPQIAATALVPLPNVGRSYPLVAPAINAAAAISAPVIAVANPVSYGSTGSAATGTGTLSYSHTIAADDNCIVVYVMSGGSSIATPTVGGVSMNVAAAAALSGNFSGVNCYLAVFYLLNPGSGAKTVQVTGISSAGNLEGHTFKNVASVGTAVSATNTTGSPSQTITTAPSALDMISNGMGSGSAAFTSYSKTQDYSIGVSSFVRWTLTVGHSVGGASQVFSASHSSSQWRSVCVPLLH